MPARIVLVHGSVVAGRATWNAQFPLEERFELLVLDRPGFPPNPPIERVDFEDDANLLCDRIREGDPSRRALLRRCDHTAGGRPLAVHSAVAHRHRAAGDPRRARRPVVGHFAHDAIDVWSNGPTDDSEAFLRLFLTAVGSSFDPPSPLLPTLEQGARALIGERGPWEAEIPLEILAAAPFPKLVVSGAHHAAFDAICDVLERELPAERLVLPGYGHTVQRHPDFNARLADFVVQRAT